MFFFHSLPLVYFLQSREKKLKKEALVLHARCSGKMDLWLLVIPEGRNTLQKFGTGRLPL